LNITNQQKKIIHSPALARLIVKAGPGTGKTFSLIERIKYLVKEEHLEPATEVLILSFSVAAAREIKNRLLVAVEEQGYDDELLFVTIRTFDSFASHFMYMLDPEIALDGCDYDQRIAMATDIILNQENAISRLQRYRHILVDEVQDLVGLRASLTLAILASSGGGFTLFGDPAQAVYNFLMEGDENGPTSDEFVQQVSLQNDGNVGNFFLAENFRVGENKTLKALADNGRRHLLESSPEEAYNFLRRTFADLTLLGSLYDVVVSENLCSPNTAFLCRTNGQVLRLARHFNEQGTRFYIRRPLETIDIPAWVGHLLSGWKTQTVRKKDFLEAMATLPDDMDLSPKQAWEELRLVTRIRTSIRVPQLRNALLEGAVFTTTAKENRDDGVVISTVHRSKGREFDTVALVIPEETDPGEFLDEGRVMFVGLTRARCNLYKMSEKGALGIRKSGERWVRIKNNKGKRYLTGVEVGCQGDIDKASSVSLKMFDDDFEEIEENQTFLWENVQYGTPARLKLFGKTNGVPIYAIWVGDDDLVVALTSEKFGFRLKEIIKEIHERDRISNYPNVIDNLWVRNIVTEVGNLGNMDVPRSYRNTGLWLGIRLQGLGTCQEWRSF